MRKFVNTPHASQHHDGGHHRKSRFGTWSRTKIFLNLVIINFWYIFYSTPKDSFLLNKSFHHNCKYEKGQKQGHRRSFVTVGGFLPTANNPGYGAGVIFFMPHRYFMSRVPHNHHATNKATESPPSNVLLFHIVPYHVTTLCVLQQRIYTKNKHCLLPITAFAVYVLFIVVIGPNEWGTKHEWNMYGIIHMIYIYI